MPAEPAITLRDTMRAGAAVRGAVPIPALPGLPVLGSMLAFQRDRLGLFDRLAALGPVVRFQLGPVPVHMINEPAIAHELLVERADGFVKSRELAVFLRPLLGDGLLTAEGALHRRQRKLMAPAFAPRRISTYAAVMADEAARTAASWCDGDTVDVAAAMMELTLAIAGRTLLGADVRGDARVVGVGFTEAMEAMLAGMTSFVQVPYRWPIPRHRRMRRAVAMLDQVVYRVIAERRASGDDRGDVLSALLAARDDDGSPMSDLQIRDEVMTLILAGHETTANTLSWTLHALGRHPQLRARVEAEVDALGGRAPGPDELAGLPFTLMVIEEALRLWPPAYALGRTAIRDVEVAGYHLPAGAAIMINTWGMHRRPDLYPQPLEFHPGRFSAEAKRSRPRGAYLPFGAGPRVCIGNHFGMIEAQIALATLVATTRLVSVGDEPRPEPLVTLRPLGGLPMKVVRR